MGKRRIPGGYMQRREFIKLIGGAMAAWPRSGQAQQPGQTRRIGVLMNNADNDTETKAQLSEFRQGLQQFGWSEDRNVRIYTRFAADRPDQYQVLAKELVALQPDVIFGYTTPINTALQRETSTIPIVFAQVSDPIGSGLIASIARPEAISRGCCCTRRASPVSGLQCSKRLRRSYGAPLSWRIPKPRPMTTSCDRLRPQHNPSRSSLYLVRSRTLLISSALLRRLQARLRRLARFAEWHDQLAP